MFGASTVHLGIAIPLGFATLRDPFGGAAIPEAVLGMILGIAAVTVLASVRRAWAIGIATTTFAILVVLYGMSITVRDVSRSRRAIAGPLSPRLIAPRWRLPSARPQSP